MKVSLVIICVEDRASLSYQMLIGSFEGRRLSARPDQPVQHHLQRGVLCPLTSRPGPFESIWLCQKHTSASVSQCVTTCVNVENGRVQVNCVPKSMLDMAHGRVPVIR